jgi:hypothetical protein
MDTDLESEANDLFPGFSLIRGNRILSVSQEV